MLAALGTAVQRRMVADVPVGVLLSGGLDSSLIVGAARRARASEGWRRSRSGLPMRASASGNEFQYSDLVASELPTTTHERIEVDAARIAARR